MPHQVVVIGAGFGGIGMAIALKQAGIEDFVVVDRAALQPGLLAAADSALAQASWFVRKVTAGPGPGP